MTRSAASQITARLHVHPLHPTPARHRHSVQWLLHFLRDRPRRLHPERVRRADFELGHRHSRRLRLRREHTHVVTATFVTYATTGVTFEALAARREISAQRFASWWGSRDSVYRL